MLPWLPLAMAALAAVLETTTEKERAAQAQAVKETMAALLLAADQVTTQPVVVVVLVLPVRPRQATPKPETVEAVQPQALVALASPMREVAVEAPTLAAPSARVAQAVVVTVATALALGLLPLRVPQILAVVAEVKPTAALAPAVAKAL